MNKVDKTDDFSFCDMPLERQSSLRKNETWLLTQLSNNACEVIPVWKGQFLFSQVGLVVLNPNDPLILENDALRNLLTISHLTFLGELSDGTLASNTKPVFSLDLSSLDLTTLFNETQNFELVDLRSSLALVTSQQSAILGYANNLGYWHRSHKFCGFCGTKTKKLHGGHTIRCNNESCSKDVFPRTDPVVIMLIEYKPEDGPAMCLLAEHHRTPEKVVSTLAGFVDPAETLEQAVIREVKEEAGVNVSNVKYITSQPWPFPSSLMLGFYGQADDPTISIDDEEIRDAKWFTADEVRSFDNWGDEGDNYKLPRKESISRYLIDRWLDNN
jgi:NAD+ diphosphatase